VLIGILVAGIAVAGCPLVNVVDMAAGTCHIGVRAAKFKGG
jgi:hypothetical protein